MQTTRASVAAKEAAQQAAEQAAKQALAKQGWTGQTWARRGVQAALVTGGMIVVGAGVAAASEVGTDGLPAPLGESALTPASENATPQPGPYRGVPAFAGELFPQTVHQHIQFNRPVMDTGPRAGGQPMAALSGTLDPVRDLLPAVENEVTREMPALRDQFWIPPRPETRAAAPALPPEPVGWFTETVSSTRRIPLQPEALLNRPVVAGMPALGTPAQGFRRSLSWTGPIGDIVTGADGVSSARQFTPRSAVPELVVPTTDPAVHEGFGQADSIVALWQNALVTTQEFARPVLTPTNVDLTSGQLGGPVTERFDVPHFVVASALSDVRRAAAPRPDFVPLEVPGEYQEKATDLPDLSQLPLLEVSKTPGTVERSGQQGGPGFEVPLGGGKKLSAFGGGQTSMPAISRITQALEGGQAPVGKHAAVEPRWASRSGHAPASGLGGLPDITLVQGHELPVLGLDPSRSSLFR